MISFIPKTDGSISVNIEILAFDNQKLGELQRGSIGLAKDTFGQNEQPSDFLIALLDILEATLPDSKENEARDEDLRLILKRKLEVKEAA